MSAANGNATGTTGTGTGSFFGGLTSASPPAIATSNTTPSNFAGFGGASTSAPSTSGLGTSSGSTPFGSGFGASANTQPTTSGFGLGSSTTQTPSTFGGSTTGGLGGGLGSGLGGGFGSSFNQSQQQQQPFGQSTFQQSSFQQPQQQQQQQQQQIPQLQPGQQSLPTSFSSSVSASTLPAKPSIFGDFGSTLRSTNSNTPAPGPSNQNYGPAKPPSIENQLALLKQKWDPTSPECIFQTYFYNRVGADQAALYTKPPNHDQKKWDEAVAARPDNSVVPVLAIGFPALKERSQLQEQQVLTYRARMHEIVGKLSELQKAHDLTTAPKVETARDKLITLSHRTLRLAAKVQVLKSRGYALRPEEEVLKERLVALERDLRDPDSFGRVGEIWARLGAVKQRLALLSQSEGQSGIDWSDEATAEMIAKVPLA
jgi:nuclear pore complex protein Nup54